MDTRSELYYRRLLKDAAEQIGLLEAVMSEGMDSSEYLSCASYLACTRGLVATMRAALIESEVLESEDLPF